jgi:hypothetical protein
MKELSLGMIIAVMEEIFGTALFWAMVAVAAVITLAYLYVLIRDRSLSMRKFLLAQLSMPFGAVAAIWFVQTMTPLQLPGYRRADRPDRLSRRRGARRHRACDPRLHGAIADPRFHRRWQRGLMSWANLRQACLKPPVSVSNTIP